MSATDGEPWRVEMRVLGLEGGGCSVGVGGWGSGRWAYRRVAGGGWRLEDGVGAR